MCVQVRDNMAQVAVLEGRSLIEHYVSRPADDISQIHGNIYVGRVQNVLPGMEAAFVDIATPKNAVLYRGDVQYDAEDIEERGDGARIEDILRPRQLIVCQVTKNPIGAKGARLTQEVSLPGRFVVLIPNSKTYGISKRLPDDVRKRLRGILDRVKPAQHGLIVRTAAEHATEEELRADMMLLLDEWEKIAAKAATAKQPTLLYREPELAVRVIREEFNADYRGVVIDDQRLHGELQQYIGAFNPELADRVEYYDHEAEGLSLFETYHVHEQVHKALDRKVWLPSRRVAHHRAHRGADGHRRQHRQERRHVDRWRRRSSTTTWRPPTRSPSSSGCATSAGSSSSTSSTWRTAPTGPTSSSASATPCRGTRPGRRSSTSPTSGSSR